MQICRWIHHICIFNMAHCSCLLGAKREQFFSLFTAAKIQPDRDFRLFEEIKDGARQQLTDSSTPVCFPIFYLCRASHTHDVSLILHVSTRRLLLRVSFSSFKIPSLVLLCYLPPSLPLFLHLFLVFFFFYLHTDTSVQTHTQTHTYAHARHAHSCLACLL